MSVAYLAKKAGYSRVSAQTVATVMLIVSLVIGGSNGVLASAVSLPSFQTVFMRASLGAVILGVMLAVAHKPLTVCKYKREGAMLAIAGAALGADWLFLFEAYGYAGVGVSTILCYCAPIIVMALSPLVFRERFTTPKLVGFSVVVLGAVLINGSSLRGGAAPYGIACGLASAVCFAAMMMFSKKADHVAGLEKVFIEIASAAAMVGIYALAVKGVSLGAVLRIPSSDVLPIALLGISTALSNYLYLKALGAISAQNVAVLGYIEPLSAAALGAVFLGETMLPLQMAGASCIVLGAIISQLHKPARTASLGKAQR